jgi:hypothetical protein
MSLIIQKVCTETLPKKIVSSILSNMQYIIVDLDKKVGGEGEGGG